MADVHRKEVRSFNMSRIKSKNTKPEILVRKLLFAHGFRFRLHNKKLPGKPDLILKKYGTVIFVNGCFWHGHKDCKYFVPPSTRRDWWLNKIQNNVNNDGKATIRLSSMGWSVITVWECDLQKSKIENTINTLINNIRSRI
jgi:DNA mismatch endonuclease (patch repair protein)